jgi:hypothetical protein
MAQKDKPLKSQGPRSEVSALLSVRQIVVMMAMDKVISQPGLPVQRIRFFEHSNCGAKKL